MKKILLVFTLLLCISSFKSFASGSPTITINNSTPYPYNCQLYAHDASFWSCGGLGVTSLYIPPSSTIGPTTVPGFNTSSLLCSFPGTGSGWSAGCASNSGTGWDGFWFGNGAYIGTPTGTVTYNPCSPPVPLLPITVPDLSTGGNINFSRTVDPFGNVTINIYP